MLINVFTKLLILPIRLYQLILSPLLGQNCNHIPSCSNYTIQALKEWGPIKGAWLASKRIFHCNPWWWGTHGEDPVPNNEKK